MVEDLDVHELAQEILRFFGWPVVGPPSLDFSGALLGELDRMPPTEVAAATDDLLIVARFLFYEGHHDASRMLANTVAIAARRATARAGGTAVLSHPAEVANDRFKEFSHTPKPPATAPRLRTRAARARESSVESESWTETVLRRG